MKTFVTAMQCLHAVLAWPAVRWVLLQRAAARWWARAGDDPLVLRRLAIGFLALFWLGFAAVVSWLVGAFR